MSDTLPNEVREAMARAIASRRFESEGRFLQMRDEFWAKHRHECFAAADAALSAIEAAGWVCVPVRATYEMETAVSPFDFPRPDIYGDIDANDAADFLASAWAAMLTASNPKEKPMGSPQDRSSEE